ncbi:MAG TPA: HAMP domain-containing sensor histidine kinase [Flavobacterium sp.]|nr:HAMP domain-containing sensor histidine kinase [Flavobacterium sp.]
MKRKIMLLIGACIFTVASLAAIQGYFIYNTYKLTEKEIDQTIRKQVGNLEDTEEWMNINNGWMEETSKFISCYVNKKAKKEEFIKAANESSDSLSGILTSYMRKISKPGDFVIGYYVYATSVVVQQNGKNDTIFKGKLPVLKNKDFLKGKEFSMSSSRWENNLENDKEKYNLIIKSDRYYSYADRKSMIISRMAGLLLFSVTLMAFVVFLYYQSLKNLISLKRIADMKTDFVNNITHEFQTPLATMDIAIKTLKRKDGQMNPEHYAATLSMVERQNDRLQKLFRQVTEVSVAPTANKETAKISCKEIKEMIEDFKISKPDVSITCHQEQEDFSISIDRFHLNTILVNLLDNAVKYGADTIEATLKRSRSNFFLSIKDNGEGIPLQEQKSIFDKFYRVEKGNIHNTKGLGLGLFYIKQLVEIYGGKIAVESSAGKGAMFLITVPI